MLSGYKDGKPKYYSGNGKTYVLNKEGFIIREASEAEAKEASEMAWGELWDDFGEGLEEDE